MSERRCGSCTLCCKLLPIRELDKPANTRCQHQSSKGCAVYHRPERGFPPSCGLWSCRWLVNPDTAALHRPDRTHYVVDIMPDMVSATNNETGEKTDIAVIQVWCDPALGAVWRRALDHRVPAVDRHGSPVARGHDRDGCGVAVRVAAVGPDAWGGRLCRAMSVSNYAAFAPLPRFWCC